MKSVLLLGQSNMAGRGFLEDVLPIVSEKIYMLRNGRFQMMAEPLHNDRPNAGIGLGPAFALAWSKDHPDETIGLIPCAEGGSSIDEWLPGTPLFRHAVSEAKFAQESSEIIAVLWHQGENDSADDKYRDYGQKLEQIVTALREELDLEEIPFLVGCLPDFLGKFGYGLYSPQYEKINDELMKFAETHKNCACVPAHGLSCNPDGIHMDAKSQRAFGLRYYYVYGNFTNPMVSKAVAEKAIARILSKPRSMKEQYFANELDAIHGKISQEELQKRQSELLKAQAA